MKICHIKSADATLESTNRFTDLVCALAGIGIRQAVIMPANERLETLFSALSIPCHIQKFSGLFDLRTQQAAQRIVDDFDPHIIQTHAADAAALAARLRHHAVRIGFTSAVEALQQKIAAASDICFTISYARPGPPLDYNILPVPPLVGDPGVAPRERQEEEITVGALIDWGPLYQLEPVFQAMREIPGIRFHLPDFSPQRRQWEQAARRQAVHDKLRFQSNALSPQDFLSALDICIVPFRKAGVDRLTLEAWSCGLCVVSGMPQERSPVEHMTNGFLVEKNDVPSWRSALRTLLDEPKKRKRYGHAGRERYEQSYQAARIVPGYLQAYETALRIKV